MQLKIKIDEQSLNLIYKFVYHLSANEKIAEKVAIQIFKKYDNSYKNNSLLLLKNVWQEFSQHYGFLEFLAGSAIQKVLLNLPPRLRCAIILKDIFNYNYSEIAYVLSITHREAQKIVARGRLEGKKILNNYFNKY